MNVCFDKRTDKPVNDFQSNSKAGTLIKNAVKRGLGIKDDFEEREISEEEFNRLEKVVNDPIRQVEIAKVKDKEKKIKSLGKKANKTVDDLFELLKLKGIL